MDNKNPLAGGGKYNLYIYKKPNTSSIMFIYIFSRLNGCPDKLGKNEKVPIFMVGLIYHSTGSLFTHRDFQQCLFDSSTTNPGIC